MVEVDCKDVLLRFFVRWIHSTIFLVNFKLELPR